MSDSRSATFYGRNHPVLLAAFGIAIVIAAAASLPWLGLSSRWLTVATQVAVNAIFAASFHLMFGLTGMLWFAQAVFFGFAGYAVTYALRGMVANDIGYFPVSLLPLVGSLVAALVGAAIGWIATRREKLAFAMISLAVTELVVGLGYVFRSISGGEEGLSADRWVGPEPLGITFGPQKEIYLLSLAWLVVGVAVVAFIERTTLGRLAMAARENSERLAFSGYDIRRVRWIVFTISSAIAGIAGSLFALNYEHVGLSLLSIEQSSLALFSVVLGGLGSLVGALAGAVAITLLNTVLADLTPVWLFYLGLTFTLLILFARSGLAGAIRAHQPLLKGKTPAVRSLLLPYFRALSWVVVCGVAGVAASETIFRHADGKSVLSNAGLLPAWMQGFILALIALGGMGFAIPACRRAKAAYLDALRGTGLGATRSSQHG